MGTPGASASSRSLIEAAARKLHDVASTERELARAMLRLCSLVGDADAGTTAAGATRVARCREALRWRVVPHVRATTASVAHACVGELCYASGLPVLAVVR